MLQGVLLGTNEGINPCLLHIWHFLATIHLSLLSEKLFGWLMNLDIVVRHYTAVQQLHDPSKTFTFLQTCTSKNTYILIYCVITSLFLSPHCFLYATLGCHEYSFRLTPKTGKLAANCWLYKEIWLWADKNETSKWLCSHLTMYVTAVVYVNNNLYN